MFNKEQLQAIGDMAEETASKIGDKVVRMEGSISFGSYPESKEIKSQLDHFRDRLKICGEVQGVVKAQLDLLTTKPIEA